MKLPSVVRLALPSGLRVEVSHDGADPIDNDVVDGVAVFGGRLWNALATGTLLVEDDVVEGDNGRWEPSSLEALRLDDYHAVRDAAFRVGAIALEEDDEVGQCRNCDEALPVRRQDAPFDDLEDWYVAPLVEEIARLPPPPFDLGAPVELGGTEYDHIVMRPVTVAEARPLWLAIAKRRPNRTTSALVRSLGIEALTTAEGLEERDTRKVARALDRADDTVWATVDTLFVHLNYSPRSYFPRVCPSCGAVHEVEAPAVRELVPDPDAERRLFGAHEDALAAADLAEGADARFPDLDTFVQLAERYRDQVYAARGVRNIDLEIVEEAADVDPAGVPLLGAYEPHYEHGVPRFRIKLYYRTFARQFEDEPYDVEAEIEETLDHEVEHHLYYLSGHDPMDEAERREADEELERTFGPRAVRRDRLRGLIAELKTMGAFALLAVLVIAGVLAVMALRGFL